MFGLLQALWKALTSSTKPEEIPANAKLSKEGIELIKHFESCLKPIGNGKFEAYADPGYGWEVPTIGWGTVEYENGRKVQKGDVITQERADQLLWWEANEKFRGVMDLVKVKLNDDQAGALTSFSYNVGLGAFKSSTLLKKLNSGDYAGAANEFPKWNKSNGKILKGLVRRRESERNLFLGKRPFIVT